MLQYLDRNNNVIGGDTNVLNTVRSMIKSDPRITDVSETTIQQLAALIVQTSNSEHRTG